MSILLLIVGEFLWIVTLYGINTLTISQVFTINRKSIFNFVKLHRISFRNLTSQSSDWGNKATNEFSQTEVISVSMSASKMSLTSPSRLIKLTIRFQIYLLCSWRESDGEKEKHSSTLKDRWRKRAPASLIKWNFSIIRRPRSIKQCHIINQ